MSRARKRGIRLAFCTLCVLLGSVSFARASATLLLEEPYGKLGAFNATGHAAVYLTVVCSESPLVLRRCRSGEPGVVLSRYNGVSGYDWIAIPLIPYLYAVERTEDVLLFADVRMVSFLRDQYRRKYLEAIVPDRNNGETPGEPLTFPHSFAQLCRLRRVRSESLLPQGSASEFCRRHRYRDA